MLAKALSHYFEAKLILLDVPDFSMKPLKRSISDVALEQMSSLFGSFSKSHAREGTLSRQSSNLDAKLRYSKLVHFFQTINIQLFNLDPFQTINTFLSIV